MGVASTGRALRLVAFSLALDCVEDSAPSLSLLSSPPHCTKETGLISQDAFPCVAPGESWPVRELRLIWNTQGRRGRLLGKQYQPGCEHHSSFPEGS